jgi:hypothetical protein
VESRGVQKHTYKKQKMQQKEFAHIKCKLKKKKKTLT